MAGAAFAVIRGEIRAILLMAVRSASPIAPFGEPISRWPIPRPDAANAHGDWRTLRLCARSVPSTQLVQNEFRRRLLGSGQARYLRARECFKLVNIE